MRDRLALIIETLACTCWITKHDWTWRIPIWPGRIPDDDDWTPGYPTHSVGSAAYTLENGILCHSLLNWIWSPSTEEAES